MAKKRQLNVRLSDTLLDQLEERVQKTKMGMAAMVEILLTQALQQDIATPAIQPEDRYDDLLKRIEAIEAKLADGDRNSLENPLGNSLENPLGNSLGGAISDIEGETAIANTSAVDATTNATTKNKSDNKSDNKLEKEIPLVDALSVEEMVNRLKVELRTLNQKKDKSTFSNWAKKHDPEGIAWQYNGVEDCFYPLAI